MKQFKLLSMLLAILMVPMMVSCVEMMRRLISPLETTLLSRLLVHGCVLKVWMP